jgi:hypothetical protein
MATTPVTQQQIDSLDKLMKVVSNATTRANFKKDPDKAVKDANVDLTLPGINDTFLHLKALSDDQLQVIANLNQQMFTSGLVENPASTTLKLSKQV